MKSKRETPIAAKDLYTSTLFAGRRSFVERSCDRWFVLSAQHGVLAPDDVIEPYDVALADQSRGDRTRWSSHVLDQIGEHLGNLAGMEFEIHAGSAYRDSGLVEGLRNAGATVTVPTEGMAFGEQLAFYTHGASPDRNRTPGARGRPSRGYELIGESLNEHDGSSVSLEFNQVEEALAGALPNSARKYREWWANTERSPQARGWLHSGWKVDGVDLAGEVVTFRRSPTPSPRATSSEPPESGLPASEAGLDRDAEPPRLADVKPTGPFTFDWPEGTEEFTTGWDATVDWRGQRHQFRHGLGERFVYGALRVHSVTFIDGGPAVEGTAADDYPISRSLVSLVKNADRRDVTDSSALPQGYERFEVVRQRNVINAPYARQSFAVTIREDDLSGWAHHALLRLGLKAHGRTGAALHPDALPDGVLPDHPTVQGSEHQGASPEVLIEALLEYGSALSQREPGTPPAFTPDPEANQLLVDDPFAFLVAVICDQGIRAERAWAAPLALRHRMGFFDPIGIVSDPEAVARAFQTRPMLHRMINVVPAWIVSAARRVIDLYDGDAGAIWAGTPSAMELQRRLRQFDGISQKKAAMAVEILERDLEIPVAELGGSDVAYDVQLRRVFLRTGLANRDDVKHMIDTARLLHPDRPGSLDFPAWDIGRRWCRPMDPRCDDCCLGPICPRLVATSDQVHGM